MLTTVMGHGEAGKLLETTFYLLPLVLSKVYGQLSALLSSVCVYFVSNGLNSSEPFMYTVQGFHGSYIAW